MMEVKENNDEDSQLHSQNRYRRPGLGLYKKLGFQKDPRWKTVSQDQELSQQSAQGRKNIVPFPQIGIGWQTLNKLIDIRNKTTTLKSKQTAKDKSGEVTRKKQLSTNARNKTQEYKPKNHRENG